MIENIRNQQLDQTTVVSGLSSGSSVGTWRADYPLTGRDFEHLRHGRPVTFNWANSVMLTTIGLLLNILGKYLSQKSGVTITIYIGEWVALWVGIIIAIILYLIGLAFPNDRKKIMKKLKEHFDNSPKKRQMLKEGE